MANFLKWFVALCKELGLCMHWIRLRGLWLLQAEKEKASCKSSTPRTSPSSWRLKKEAIASGKSEGNGFFILK
jgi:hypothetical protein